MTNLVLHLKKEYFDQVASGAKVEEYRLVTPYWSKRLEGRQYDNVVLLCGYPARGDTSRQIVRPWRGYVRKTITHQHFGNSPVEVFAISLAHLTQDAPDLAKAPQKDGPVHIRRVHGNSFEIIDPPSG
jgi:hypothetical protein